MSLKFDNLNDVTNIQNKTKAELLYEIVLAEIKSGHDTYAVSRAEQIYYNLEKDGIIQTITPLSVEKLFKKHEGELIDVGGVIHTINNGKLIPYDQDWEGK